MNAADHLFQRPQLALQQAQRGLAGAGTHMSQPVCRQKLDGVGGAKRYLLQRASSAPVSTWRERSGQDVAIVLICLAGDCKSPNLSYESNKDASIFCVV